MGISITLILFQHLKLTFKEGEKEVARLLWAPDLYVQNDLGSFLDKEFSEVL